MVAAGLSSADDVCSASGYCPLSCGHVFGFCCGVWVPARSCVEALLGHGAAGFLGHQLHVLACSAGPAQATHCSLHCISMWAAAAPAFGARRAVQLVSASSLCPAGFELGLVLR
jgi:hypothetical protein